MGFLQNLFSGGASQLVSSIGSVLDNVITTREEKMQLENEQDKAEMEYQIEIKKLSVQERQLVYQDVSSARQRETEIQKSDQASWLGKNTASMLALGTTVLAFSLFYFMAFNKGEVKEAQKDILIYILGVLSAIVTQIFSYYFGSSAGSAQKSKTIEGELSKR